MSLKKKGLLTIAFVGVVFTIIFPLFAPDMEHLDFLRYWASSNLFITGKNAYDNQSLMALERSAYIQSFHRNNDEEYIVESWNPPWQHLILAPLGWMPFGIALRVWIFTSTMIIGFSSWLVWEMLGLSGDEKGFSLLLASIFWSPNVILTLQLGQISSFLLLAVVLFIFLIQKKKDFYAGVVLFPLTIKPHISYMLLLTILIWILMNRRWGVLAGGISISLLFLGSIFVISPDWPANYFFAISKLPFQQVITSTIGSLVQLLTGFPWLKYLGILLLPLAYYFARNIKNIGWLTTSNIVLLISLPLSFYGFSFDQIVFLPAIAQMIAWLRQEKVADEKRKFIIVGILLVYLLSFLIRIIPSVVYSWTVLPALVLLWVYNFALKSTSSPTVINLKRGDGHALNDSI